MHPNCFRYYAEMTTENRGENAEMSKQQVVKALKDILFSDDFKGTAEQENALIIAIAEVLKG